MSQKNFPMRFSRIADIDDAGVNLWSGFMHTIKGEQARKLIAVSGSLMDNNDVFLFTDRSVWGITGFRIKKISNNGTIAADSVSEGDGVIYWVDSHLVVRADGVDISRYTVHDKLLDVPKARRPFMSGQVWQGRYHLAMATGSDDDNRLVGIYNPHLAAWESWDLLPNGKEPQQFHIWHNDFDPQIVYLDPGGHIFEYETNTTDDDGAQMPIQLDTHEIHNPDWSKVKVGQFAIVCSDKDSETLTRTRTAGNPAGTEIGTCSLDAGA
ncbi:MAG: hypothetical protein IIC57_05745, partial [Proteobacteria bacterium]|nr:hypothetical protein [Pseudomonadota bacterium]